MIVKAPQGISELLGINHTSFKGVPSPQSKPTSPWWSLLGHFRSLLRPSGQACGSSRVNGAAVDGEEEQVPWKHQVTNRRKCGSVSGGPPTAPACLGESVKWMA